MASVLEDTLRAALLKEVGRFVERARHLAGVERIALIGSLTTPKEHPKDADVLTTISDDVDLAAPIGNATRGWPVAEGSVPFPPTSVTTSMRSAWRND
jgi:hypothetical protein